MRNSFIYTLTDPITNKIRYVGKTDYLEKRLRSHLNNNKNRTHKERWITSLKDMGLSPIMEVIDIVNENWQYWEVFWISQIRSWGFDLVNATDGGEGGNITDEIRKKISYSKIGNQNRLGAKLSKETKEKIRIKNSGKKQPIDQVLKRAEKNTKYIDIGKLKLEYDRGLSYSEIGKLFNLSASKIYKEIKKNNLIKREVTDYGIIDLIRLKKEIDNGLTVSDISRLLGYSRRKIKEAIEKNGLTTNLYEKFKIIDECELRKDIEMGLSYKQMMTKYEVSKSKLYRNLKKYNLIKK